MSVYKILIDSNQNNSEQDNHEEIMIKMKKVICNEGLGKKLCSNYHTSSTFILNEGCLDVLGVKYLDE